MPGMLETLKKEAPAAYWTAVDMARDGHTPDEIRQEIRRRLTIENEKRAITGRRPAAVAI